MSVRIGLSVGSDTLRAVGVRAGAVLWAIEAERSLTNDLARDVVQLLRRATLPRWPRATVMAAIGPSASQTKLLTGLPPLIDPHALCSIVRENVSRFFLKNGVPVVMAGVKLEAPGSVWATALELPVVHGIESACRTLGLRVRLIAPSIVALTRGCEDQQLEWPDGEMHTEITINRGRLCATRRLAEARHTAGGHAKEPRTVAALQKLGEGAWRYADAYGATQLSAEEPLALRSRSGDIDADAARRGVRVAAAALCLATVAALGAPVTVFAARAHRTSRELATIAHRAREAEIAEVDLARMSAALSEISTFDSSRRSPTLMLSSLSRALPDGSVLVTVQVDSSGGTVALLTPRAASVLAALDSMSSVTSPQIIGPVTKELVGARELERATVQFRFAARTSRTP